MWDLVSHCVVKEFSALWAGCQSVLLPHWSVIFKIYMPAQLLACSGFWLVGVDIEQGIYEAPYGTVFCQETSCPWGCG